MQKTQTKSTKVADLKFLRLPIDDLTKTILEEVKNDNPYFTDLDSIRWIMGKFYKNNSRKKLLAWMDQNVGSKNLPKMTEDEILLQIQDI
jgi:uncharacterized membrane protein YgaE (UPF0421/DUF939 family)